MDVKSVGSNDSIYARSTESSSCKDLGPDSHQGDPENMEPNFSALGSHYSLDDGSMGREYYSPTYNLISDERNVIATQDLNRSNSLPFHSQTVVSDAHSQSDYREFSTLSSRISETSRNLLEAAEDTIDQLRTEAKMWERNARKLMIDLDTSRKEFCDLSKKHANSEIELSAAWAECDMLKKEVKKSMAKQTAIEEPLFRDNRATFQKELEDEIRFQRESNTNLALQLERSQEANAELVSVLQELEETIEKQKDEIEHLSELQSRLEEMENFLQVSTEENQKLKLQQQQFHELKTKFVEQSMKNKDIYNIEIKYKTRLSAKEKEIVSLKTTLLESSRERRVLEAALNGDYSHLIEEIESLKGKLQELETDCDELTDENLSLLLKLKETTNGSVSEPSDREIVLRDLEERLKNKVLREAGIDGDISIQRFEALKLEMEDKIKELGTELTIKRADVDTLEATLLSNEQEVSSLQRSRSELEAKVSNLEKRNAQLKEDMQLSKGEVATKSLNDLRNDMSTLSNSVSSHVSVNRSLQKKSLDLESQKHELLLRLAELEKENMQLSECIACLEAQLKGVTDENESSKLELMNSRSLASNLQDELKRLRNEMETQIADLTQELQSMHDWQLEAQADCEYLRTENAKLQATAEILIEDHDSAQRSNVDLKNQIFESQEYRTQLEFRRVEKLEENISSMLKEFNSKENHLSSEMQDNESYLESAHSKIESLENELAKAMEANKKHKIQLKRLLMESRNGIKNSSRNSRAEDEVVALKENFERIKSSQETELKELQERYLSMSLRYAEVEAEREELVMKLKIAKDGIKR